MSVTQKIPAAMSPQSRDPIADARVRRTFWQWLSNDPGSAPPVSAEERDQLDWLRVTPFVIIHLGCLMVFEVGASVVAVSLAAGLYLARMFFITAFYHRYFSHRAFRAGRWMQFAMAVLGCTAGQRGPLWWASHHREHHINSDTAEDPHSPAHRGVLFSHTLWFLTRGSFAMREERVQDWLRFPELRLLERVDWVPLLALAAACYGLGAWLEAVAPGLKTNGPQMLTWGFFVSTVVLYHATFTINSLAHRYGRRRFDTPDDSRNNLWLALLTLGEGWHNNHHFYPASARQGFAPWELDISYWGLRILETLGLVRDLRSAPERVMAAAGSPGGRSP